MKNLVTLTILLLASWVLEILGGILIIHSFPEGGILAGIADVLMAVYLGVHLLWAGLSLLWPRYERLKLRARNPGEHERQQLDTALAVLQRARPDMVLPGCMIVDRLGLSICWIGSVLVIDQPLLHHRHFHALLAHALGHDRQDHMAHGLFAMLPAPYTLVLGAIGLPFGVGTALLYPAWQWYWRRRIYVADAFAYGAGQGHALIRALKELSLSSDSVTGFGSGFNPEPSVQMRIHRLEQRLVEPAVVTVHREM